jgi:small subunit ribosomal protein S1
MSYGRVNKPADVVTAGQTVEVKILKFDPKSRKVSLGLKQTMPDPWDQVPGKYTEGQQTTGRVVRLADFGAFVELEAGIDCLVPVSELSWTQRVHRPGDVLKVDQVVTGVILRVEPEKRRISMSLKRIEEDPWALVEEQYPQSTVLKGKVARITEFGAFVEIHPGVDGLVHISELSDQRVRTVSDVVQEGQEVECKVLSVDREARKISLTIKGVHADGAEAIAEEVVTKPRSKRKTPLRGGLESQGGWFIG